MLKEIRKKIAEENDIEYVTSECKFQGECRGTCPKCEAELKFLEDELNKRRSVGKKVAVAGIAASMMVTATGCEIVDIFSRPEVMGDMPVDNGYTYSATPIETQPRETEELDGDVALDGDIVPEMGTFAPTETESNENEMQDMGELQDSIYEEPDNDDENIPLMGTAAPVETDFAGN
jgi:hypothetical protein